MLVARRGICLINAPPFSSLPREVVADLTEVDAGTLTIDYRIAYAMFHYSTSTFYLPLIVTKMFNLDTVCVEVAYYRDKRRIRLVRCSLWDTNT